MAVVVGVARVGAALVHALVAGAKLTVGFFVADVLFVSQRPEEQVWRAGPPDEGRDVGRQLVQPGHVASQDAPAGGRVRGNFPLEQGRRRGVTGGQENQRADVGQRELHRPDGLERDGEHQVAPVALLGIVLAPAAVAGVIQRAGTNTGGLAAVARRGWPAHERGREGAHVQVGDGEADRGLDGPVVAKAAVAGDPSAADGERLTRVDALTRLAEHGVVGVPGGRDDLAGAGVHHLFDAVAQARLALGVGGVVNAPDDRAGGAVAPAPWRRLTAATSASRTLEMSSWRRVGIPRAHRRICPHV